jgi:ABC-type lipopolysaccharide export system ATPase subunit
MIMNSLVPDRGQIEVLGERSTTAARDRVSYLPEERGLYKQMTVRRLLRYYGALKGGERRRCEIARALAADPSIMLLDEPFAGIDPISISDIRELVRELKKRDIGVLITDHNVRETLDIVDRACIIYDGQVLFAGTPQALVADHEVRRLYLGESFAL